MQEGLNYRKTQGNQKWHEVSIHLKIWGGARRLIAYVRSTMLYFFLPDVHHSSVIIAIGHGPFKKSNFAFQFVATPSGLYVLILFLVFLSQSRG